MLLEVLAGLVFSGLICGLLTVTYRSGYRSLADPNAVFRDSRRPPILRRSLFGILLFGAFVYPLMVAIRVYLLAGVLAATLGSGHWASWLGLAVFGGALLCELVVVSHLLFYLKLCYDGAAHYVLPEVLPVADGEPLPQVALLIPSCDESVETLLRPFDSLHHIRYPRCRIVLVENSRDPEAKSAAIALAARYGIEVFDFPNRGTKAAALNDARTRLGADTKYVGVLDADQQLGGDLVSVLVALLEAEPEVGWYQTPQTYDVDASSSLLGKAAAQQLISLFDGSLQGKDVRRVCPLLGTGCLVRVDALDSVGGWSEDFVNEDTPTSYFMQLRGWQGRYFQQLFSSGVAPPTLQSLWRQQARWSHANSKLAFEIIGGFFRSEKRPLPVVFDYLAFVSYELLTFLIALLSLMPSAYLLGSFYLVAQVEAIPSSVDAMQWAFASLYPFYLLLLFFPLLNLGIRGYPMRNVMLAQGLNTCLGSAYLRGARRTILGERIIFESAQRQLPHGSGTFPRTPLLSMQLVAFVVFISVAAAAVAMGLMTQGSPLLLIVVFWSAYNAFCVGHYILFVLDERRETVGQRAKERLVE